MRKGTVGGHETSTRNSRYLARNNPEEPMGLILKVQEYKRKDFEFLNPEDGKGRWSRNVGNKSPLLAA